MFIFNLCEQSLWLNSHSEVRDNIVDKCCNDEMEALLLTEDL